jgi:hypothetical protein
VVDVLDERVERAHSLGEAALDDPPLVRGQDARNQVERERPVSGWPSVGTGRVEGDALLDEDRVAALARGPEPLAPEALQRARERRRGGARSSRALEELVEEALRRRVLDLGGGFYTRSEPALRLAGR